MSELPPAAEWVAVETLTPWEDNPRKIRPAAIKKVAASIEAYGFASPIIARAETNQIVCGHTRYLAAKKIGMTHVLVRFMPLTEAQARGLAVADNRTHEETEWDDEKLGTLLETIRKEGDDLSATGFDTFELASALKTKGEIEIEAPRTTREESVELVRFRMYKLSISPKVADELGSVLEAFAGERGSLNGFVEHVLSCLSSATPSPN